MHVFLVIITIIGLNMVPNMEVVVVHWGNHLCAC